jgi:hypothetical protein
MPLPRSLLVIVAALLAAAVLACDSGGGSALFRGVPVFPAFAPLERPAADLDPLSRDALESAALHRDVDSSGKSAPLIPPAWKACLDLTADVVSDQQKFDEQSQPWRRLVFQDAALAGTQLYSAATSAEAAREYYERELPVSGWKVEETFVRTAMFREVWAVGISRDGSRVRGFVAFERQPGAPSGCGFIAVAEVGE